MIEEKISPERINQFVNSDRGKYIISQALCVAVETMKKRKPVEKSNIQDMNWLIKHAFPLYRAMQEAEKKFKDDLTDEA